jgi:hypothetical protein
VGTVNGVFGFEVQLWHIFVAMGCMLISAIMFMFVLITEDDEIIPIATFCRYCGASIPHRDGEGRCPKCMHHMPYTNIHKMEDTGQCYSIDPERGFILHTTKPEPDNDIN